MPLCLWYAREARAMLPCTYLPDLSMTWKHVPRFLRSYKFSTVAKALQGW